MPMFVYKCECKRMLQRFFRRPIDAPKELLCTECEKTMKRQLSASSFESKLIVDNGLQARQVEVNPDIIEINKDRANKDYRED